MDKNYNVDDILLDIKSRKSRQKGQESPQKPLPDRERFPASREPEDSLTFAPPPEPEEEVKVAFPKGERPKRDKLVEEQATGVFDFVPPERERRNLTDPDGHVQSITDRAKARQSRYGKIARQRQEDTAVIDFSTFRANAGKSLLSEDDEDEETGHTRILPKLSASREIDLDEIMAMDFGEGDYDDDDDYEDDMDDGQLHRPAIDFSEYNSIDDRRDVAIDIARVKLWLVIRTLLTFLLTVVLGYLVLSGKYLIPLPERIVPELDMKAFLLSITIVTVLIAVVNSSAMGGGIIGLFKMRSNSDTLAALGMLGAIGQCIYVTANHESARPAELTIYCIVAALGMLFNALGKMSMISRIQANFKIISSDKPKKAVLLVENDSFCREFVKGTPKRPAVAVAADCGFFTDFLALSYSDKYDVGINKVVAPICLLGAAVVGVLTYMLTQGDAMTAVTALTGILCIAATFSATFIENVPLSKLTKKLAPKGGMVSGNKAVEDFSDVSAVILTEKDLFPEGRIQVVDMKVYAQDYVAEAILDAASVTAAADSAMAGAFLKMIGGKKKLLKSVENVKFEDDRGLSAWVNGKRVLIGNYKLLQANGIAGGLDAAAAKKLEDSPEEVLYLCSGGELRARFLIRYEIDEELAVEMDKMALQEKILVVHTIDPNLSAEKLWELYGYPEELIRVMPEEMHEQYAKMTEPRGSELAEIAYTGRASAMIGSILACVSARSSILAATVVQLIQIALGYGVVALLAFLGNISTMTVLVMGAYQFFWFLVIFLIQKIRSA